MLTHSSAIIISNVVDTFVKENKEFFFLEFDADERFSNFIMSVVETLLETDDTFCVSLVFCCTS